MSFYFYILLHFPWLDAVFVYFLGFDDPWNAGKMKNWERHYCTKTPCVQLTFVVHFSVSSCLGGLVFCLCHIPLPRGHSREDGRTQAEHLAACRRRKAPSTRWGHFSLTYSLKICIKRLDMLIGCLLLSVSELAGLTPPGFSQPGWVIASVCYKLLFSSLLPFNSVQFYLSVLLLTWCDLTLVPF